MHMSLAPRVGLLILALVSSSTALSGPLNLVLKGPPIFSLEKDPRLVFDLTNNGDHSINLLKDPRGLLTPLPTNVFTFTDEKGSTALPKFIGVKVKYNQGATSPDSHVSLKPGDSIQVVHNLSKTYDLSTLPPGTYNVTGNRIFYQYDTASGVVTPLNATSDTFHHTFELKYPNAGPELKSDATDPPSNSNSTTQSGPNYVNCTAEEQTALATAAIVAQNYAFNASSYASPLLQGTSRYNTWFGLYTKTRHDLVAAQFSAISSNNFSSFTYDCSCDSSDIYAYVYPDNFGYIYLCGAFWGAPMNGTDSKGGTLVHEASHFTANAGGTEDYAYGQNSCQFLALLSPGEAVTNADSHEYFAENNPFLA